MYLEGFLLGHDWFWSFQQCLVQLQHYIQNKVEMLGNCLLGTWRLILNIVSQDVQKDTTIISSPSTTSMPTKPPIVLSKKQHTAKHLLSVLVLLRQYKSDSQTIQKHAKCFIGCLMYGTMIFNPPMIVQLTIVTGTKNSRDRTQ